MIKELFNKVDALNVIMILDPAALTINVQVTLLTTAINAYPPLISLPYLHLVTIITIITIHQQIIIRTMVPVVASLSRQTHTEVVTHV